jgi:asparagine synthase (glutamine-hydrolysing)
MCGIAGIYAYHSAANLVDQQELIRIRDSMTPRGPDGRGEWRSHSERVAFGHRRLSIIDCSNAGAQPMASPDGKFIVTFNGEIYNYRGLRSALQAEGRVFCSQSDTEVLLHLYAQKGEAMVHDLRGMFAFSIWDCQRQCLFLARDPYGIKPLYYADDGRTIKFASSVKALLAGGRISRDPDPAGVVGFHLLGSVPEPFTTYRDIRSLPAGSWITVNGAGIGKLAQYASISSIYRDAEAQAQDVPEADIHELFREALADSVRHHLVSDVPVGAFLSAGVDSGALVGLMRDAGQSDIRTVTLAFEEFRGTNADEAPLADLVARHYGTRHTTRWVGSAEFRSDLPKIIEAMDQPSIDGINTWFVSKAAHEHGLKVAVSGVGGDELLGGYSTFKSLPGRVGWLRLLPWQRRLGAGFGSLVGAARALGFQVHPKSAGLVTYGSNYSGAYLLGRGLFLPAEVGSIIHDEEMVREGLARLSPVSHIQNVLSPQPQTGFGKVAVLESSMYLRNQLLRDTDWAGMAHSLEIRTPLVDHTLLRKVAPIMVKQTRPSGKTLLAEAPKLGLPKEIVNRRKSGFGIPVRPWFRNIIGEEARGDTAKMDERLWSRSWARQIFAMASEGAKALTVENIAHPPSGWQCG